jgi:hypothetical protein
MPKTAMLGWSGLLWVGPLLACSVLRQTPHPIPTLERLSFEIQTATPTLSLLLDAPTATVDPNVTATPTATLTFTQVISPASTGEPVTEPATATDPAAPLPSLPTAEPPEPLAAPLSEEPAVPMSDPIGGGEWDFEAGFVDWANPYGDRCDGAGLAVGWNAFTTRDQFGSSCFNQTTWRANVYSGESAQEITFAFIGNEAGIFKSTPTKLSHRYKVAAYVRREPSPAKVQVWLGIDGTGNTDWQADTVVWFPWDDETEDQWTKTEALVTATREAMTVYIRGRHPEPVGGGALRIDSITIVDLGPEG